MAKLDGTNGLIQQYDYQVLTTAFSYTFAAGTQTLIINPAGTLATGTVTMPAAPADGMVITVESTQIIGRGDPKDHVAPQVLRGVDVGVVRVYRLIVLRFRAFG